MENVSLGRRRRSKMAMGVGLKGAHSSGATSNGDRMEALIPVINKLQDVFNTVGEAKVYYSFFFCVCFGSKFCCVFSVECVLFLCCLAAMISSRKLCCTTLLVTITSSCYLCRGIPDEAPVSPRPHPPSPHTILTVLMYATKYTHTHENFS